MIASTDAPITYRATLIEPGTPYSDEPDHTITPGWWVTGWSDANDEHPNVLLHVDTAQDDEGNDTSQAAAERIAALLNATRDAGLCPSCAPDGGYGGAVAGRDYHCPACGCTWSPWPDGGAAPNAWSRWWQRIKVALTGGDL